MKIFIADSVEISIHYGECIPLKEEATHVLLGIRCPASRPSDILAEETRGHLTNVFKYLPQKETLLRKIIKRSRWNG